LSIDSSIKSTKALQLFDNEFEDIYDISCNELHNNSKPNITFSPSLLELQVKNIKENTADTVYTDNLFCQDELSPFSPIRLSPSSFDSRNSKETIDSSDCEDLDNLIYESSPPQFDFET
jgi:hypothetical protein